MRPITRHLLHIGLCITVGCAPLEADTDPVTRSTSAVIYGADDRREYYEVQDASTRRLFEAHSVVFVRNYRIQPLLDGNLTTIPSWQDLEQLCPGEPFSDQPAAAFCSGVLMADGLALTSRHCFSDMEFSTDRVVFGYYLDESKRISITTEDVHEITSILSSGQNAIDYAWVHFAGTATKKRFPPPVASSASHILEDEPLIAVNSGGGIPLKLDRGAIVVDARPGTEDYFIADLDTFRGASGSGVFNTDGALAGIVKGGSTDFVRTESGCRKTVQLPRNEAREQVLHIGRAIAGLCITEPTQALCHAMCEVGNSCIHNARPSHSTARADCTLNRTVSRHGGWVALPITTLIAIAALRRQHRTLCSRTT